ncbi:MAG: hypothetical protein ACR2JP_11835 [Acidimicrobiia bacterium]
MAPDPVDPTEPAGDPLTPGTATGDDLGDVARRGAREYDLEMADAEQEAERFRLRGRTVVDTLWEAMNHGDGVTVTLGRRTLSGTLLAARNDLALLALPEALAAVRVGAIGAIRLDPAGQGVAGDRVYGSFVAYLRMLEIEEPPVTVLGDGFEVAGTVAAVTPDHILVATRSPSRWVIPIRAIDAVIGPPPKAS